MSEADPDRNQVMVDQFAVLMCRLSALAGVTEFMRLNGRATSDDISAAGERTAVESLRIIRDGIAKRQSKQETDHVRSDD